MLGSLPQVLFHGQACRKSGADQKMEGRFIILRVNGYRPEITDVHEAALLEAQGDPTEEMLTETWWHCSTFSLKLWRISFRRCEFDRVDGDLVHLTALIYVV